MSLYSDYGYMQGYSASGYFGGGTNNTFAFVSNGYFDALKKTSSSFSSDKILDVSSYAPDHLLVNSAGLSAARPLSALDDSYPKLMAGFGLEWDPASSTVHKIKDFVPNALNEQEANDLVAAMLVADDYHTKAMEHTGSVFGNSFPVSNNGVIAAPKLKGLKALTFVSDGDSGQKPSEDKAPVFDATTVDNNSTFMVTDATRSIVAGLATDLQRWKLARGGSENMAFTEMEEAARQFDGQVYGSVDWFARDNPGLVTFEDGKLVPVAGQEEAATKAYAEWTTNLETVIRLKSRTGRQLNVKAELGAGFENALVKLAFLDSGTDAATGDVIDKFKPVQLESAKNQLAAHTYKRIDEVMGEADPISAARRFGLIQQEDNIIYTYDEASNTVFVRPNLQGGPTSLAAWLTPETQERMAESVGRSTADGTKLMASVADRITETVRWRGTSNPIKNRTITAAGTSTAKDIAPAQCNALQDCVAQISAFDGTVHKLGDEIKSNGNRYSLSIKGSDLFSSVDGMFTVQVHDNSTGKDYEEVRSAADLASVAPQFARLADTRISLEKQQNQLVGDLAQVVDTGFFYDENVFGEKKFHWDAIIAMLTGIAGAVTSGGALWAQIDTARKNRHWQERAAAQEHEWAMELQRLANEGSLAVANAGVAKSTGAAVGGSSGTRIRVNTHAN